MRNHVGQAKEERSRVTHENLSTLGDELHGGGSMAPCGLWNLMEHGTRRSRTEELEENKDDIRKYTAMVDVDAWLGFSQLRQNVSYIEDEGWRQSRHGVTATDTTAMSGAVSEVAYKLRTTFSKQTPTVWTTFFGESWLIKSSSQNRKSCETHMSTEQE